MSLHAKITLLILVVVLGVGVSSALLVSRIMSRTIDNELEHQATLVAEVLSEHITHEVIEGEAIPTREALLKMKKRTEGVAYVYVVDFEGRVLAHTFNGGFPVALARRPHRHIDDRRAPLISEFIAENWRVLDVGTPLVGGMRAHIHVGMDLLKTQATVQALNRSILGLTLLLGLVGVGIGFVLSRRFTQPLEILAQSMQEFGKLEGAGPVQLGSGGKEVENLMAAFNVMRADIEEANRQLKAQTELLCQSQELAHIGSWLLDSDLNGMAWSQEVFRILELDPDQVRSSPQVFVERIHPEDRETVLNEFNSKRQTREGFDITHRVQRQSGEVRLVRLKTEIKNQSEEIFYWRGTIHDITEQAQLEDQLMRAQKMEAIGQLAGGVAHDFNNLLQIIQSSGELAMNAVDLGHPALDQLNEILKTTERAAVLVRQLLALGRRQVLELKSLNLNEIVGDVTSMIERVIGEHITLEIRPCRSPDLVLADRGQIEHILINLCVNSRDAMPRGGTIGISCENVLIDAEFCESHQWAEPGRYVMLSITDTGQGMDPETLEHLFEPFFTTKSVGHGTGLGLATVYGIVKQHRGLIHVYSEKNKGSTFEVYLPVAEGAAATERMQSSAGGVRGGNETILVAEDDDAVLKLDQQILENNGYRTIVSRTGREAVEIFARHAEEVDMLLLDVVMPEMGGRRAYEMIREKRPEIPVLFASGLSGRTMHGEFALEKGMNLIEKPYRAVHLLQRVRSTLDAKWTPTVGEKA